MGLAPDLAARLQALAEPDQVVVGASTRALPGDHVEFPHLGPHALKGFADPVMGGQPDDTQPERYADPEPAPRGFKAVPLPLT